MKNVYEVIVGNVGLVHTDSNLKNALKEFNEYKRLSKIGYGRVAYEEVTLFKNGEPYYSYIPF